MMHNILVVALAVILLAGLLHYESKEKRRGRLATKTALSILFVLAVLIQPHLIPRYYHLILLGLVFCLAGDVCLALPQGKAFLFGLVFFLFGHLSYIFGFFYLSQTSLWTWVGCLIALAISSLVYFWLWPHLGSMKAPVLLYVLVISIMAAGAWSVLGDANLTRSGRIMAFAGALSFYFSDVFVARDRFLRREFSNRLFGLPMYYAGQFLLAFSVGMLGWSSPG